MPDLDDVLNAASGRQIGDRAGRAAGGGAGIDELARRGVRRGQRLRAAAVAGVAAATVAAVGIGVGLSGGLSADAPPPVDVPSEDATTGDRRALEDLTPEEVVASRFAGPVEVALGDEPDARLVWWRAAQRGTCRAVGAVTADDGESWSWADLPGRGCASGTTVVALPDGGGWALSRYLSPDVLVIGLDGSVASVRPVTAAPGATGSLEDDDVLLPVGPDEITVTVSPGGEVAEVPWASEPNTSAESRDPRGRVVSATAGADFGRAGVGCCFAGAALRWSVDGGTTFETYELAGGSGAPGAQEAQYGLSDLVVSYAEDTLAVIEGGETVRGPGNDEPVVYGGVHRVTDDGATSERFELLPGSGAFDVPWSLVAPDGTLLIWHDTLGLLRSDGDDWSSLDLVTVELPSGPAQGVPTGLANLLDHREVDGELQLLVRTADGGYLLSSDTGRTWTEAAPLP